MKTVSWRFTKVLVMAIMASTTVSFITSCKATRSATVNVEEPLVEEVDTESFVKEDGSIDYYNATTWILGYYDRTRLEQYPHEEWFTKGYEDYVPESIPLNFLFDLRWDNVTMKVVMGSWCPDSHREVPRFMKIMDIIGFPSEKITFIGTDIEKLSPVGGFEELDIQRVPTFIFYIDNLEAGRIIEVPTTSLEEDIVNILFDNKK